MFPKNLANLVNFFSKTILWPLHALYFSQVAQFCTPKNANVGSKIRKLLLLLLVLLLLLDHYDSNKVIVIKCFEVEVKRKYNNP
jgi:hypothetical protein